MPFIRYLIILALFYVLYRLIRASVQVFFGKMQAHQKQKYRDPNNVSGGKKANIDDIEEAKYEEIKDDPKSRKN
jgi:hypothetical protein